MSKNVSKKNEQKLKTYLSKLNDVQSNHKDGIKKEVKKDSKK